MDSDEFGQCMALTDEATCMGSHIIILDGGSDAHVANRAFCRGLPVEPSTAKLRDVQKTHIPVAGAAKVPLVLDKTQSALSRFDIAEVARPLWSVGLLYDAGYDVIISHSISSYIALEDRPDKHIQIQSCRKLLRY